MSTDYARTDTYPPAIEAMSDREACQFETHAPGCPCRMGGDPRYLESFGPCAICGRDTDGSSVNVSNLGVVCSVCWEKGDEGIDIPLDYTEDDDGRRR